VRVSTYLQLINLILTPWLAATAFAEDSDTGGLQEVTVTATRQEEPLSKVPISVSVFGQEQMDAQGVKQLDDLVRLTPGLNLTRNAATGANQIAIRGISSSAGSGTTGVYIDDTPIQVRNLGFGAGTAFPGFFDLERVEVLRGPQGTLFGAGSEGGTIRFIQTSPDLAKYSGYGRAEMGQTSEGDVTYEGGYAFGGPIVTDRLGFRVSAFYRREGGYIDAVTGNFQILDPTGESYGDSTAFTRTSTVDKDVNWNRTTAFRAALKFAATDSLTITPSVSYQKRHFNDGQGSTYWLSTSNGENYSRPFYRQGDPATDPSLTAMDVPDTALGDDEFTLSALGVNWNFGAVTFVSSTSYFHRNNGQWFDFTRGYLEFYQQAIFPDGGYPPDGYKAMTVYDNKQRNFVQELRLQSADTSARVTWVAGAFFSHNKQVAGQPISVNFLAHSPYVGFAPDFAGFDDGAPYGPGSTALENFLGIDLLPNSVIYRADWQTVEEQVAGFAQADFKVTDRFKVTAGVRYSRNKLKYDAAFGAPETNGAAPFGLPCVPGTFCATPDDEVPVGAFPVGTGPFTPVFPSSSSNGSESAFTPKVGATFQITDNQMLYATAAKGFRPAGASLRVPTVCLPDLETFGYLDANGNSTQPLTYGSDTVWSYELGTKNRLFNDRLVLDGSVYQIKWKKIQTSVFLPNCAYDFVDNLADATAKGFDIGFQARPIDSVTLGGSVGYTHATFDGDALSPSGRKIYRKGAGIPDAGSPWTVSLSGQYDFHLFGAREFYMRADYTRTTEARRVGSLDPVSPSYNPLLKPEPAYAVLNARFGAHLGAFDVSLFANNVTNAKPALDLTGGGFYDPQDWTNVTLRPRTYGVTLSYRN
jgi:outer membrane receptor protein involved in Fe transport